MLRSNVSPPVRTDGVVTLSFRAFRGRLTLRAAPGLGFVLILVKVDWTASSRIESRACTDSAIAALTGLLQAIDLQRTALMEHSGIISSMANVY